MKIIKRLFISTVLFLKHISRTIILFNSEMIHSSSLDIWVSHEFFKTLFLKSKRSFNWIIIGLKICAKNEFCTVTMFFKNFHPIFYTWSNNIRVSKQALCYRQQLSVVLVLLTLTWSIVLYNMSTFPALNWECSLIPLTS